MKVKEFFKNKNLYLRYIPMSLAAFCLIFFATRAALYPPEGETVNIPYHIFKTLPTLITLVVQILLMSANRYGFLLGGTNAAIYGIVYLIEGVPFSACSALLISFPLQIYSFFNWKKNSKGKDVDLRWLPLHGKAIALGAVAALWAFCFFVLAKNNIIASDVPLFDTLTFSIGLVVTALSAIRYIDSQFMNCVSCALGLTMWIILTIKDPSNVSHAIIAVYNLYCVTQIGINWSILYSKNKKKKALDTKEASTAEQIK